MASEVASRSCSVIDHDKYLKGCCTHCNFSDNSVAIEDNDGNVRLRGFLDRDVRGREWRQR